MERKNFPSFRRIESKIFQMWMEYSWVKKNSCYLANLSYFNSAAIIIFTAQLFFITTKLSISRYLAILKSNRLRKTIRNLSRKWMARMCMQMIDFSTVEPPRATSLFLPSSYYYKHILSRTVASYLTASSMLN